MSFILLFSLSMLQATPNLPDSTAAQQLIDWTKNNRARYTVVSRNEIPRDDATIYEFSAEFNEGDLHRVETPRDRVVTNCRTGWIAHLNVATGEITHDAPLSGVACGIYTGDKMVSAEISSAKSSKFGPIKQLHLKTASGLTRIYGVASNGAIVAEQIIDPAGKTLIVMTALSLSDRLPSVDLFTEASLSKSAISDEVIELTSKPAN